MNAREIDALVYQSGHRLKQWQEHPALMRMVGKHFTHVQQRLNYYRFLYYLVAKMQPTIAVELGVEFGIASAHMVAAAHAYGGTVVGIDINERLVEWDAMQEAWPGTYTFIHGDSVSACELVETMVENVGKIGVVFQDSSHHYAPSCQEWDHYRPLMADNGVWVCDDITPSFYEAGVDEKSMVAYFDERPGREKRTYKDVLHFGNTVGVILL
jgi:predicted O-methyltransferase YrrM